MQATVKKITEIHRTRMIDDGWEDEYTEGMELLGGETIQIYPMFIIDADERVSKKWFTGYSKELGNRKASFNWHISWLKDFRDE